MEVTACCGSPSLTEITCKRDERMSALAVCPYVLIENAANRKMYKIFSQKYMFYYSYPIFQIYNWPNGSFEQKKDTLEQWCSM